MTWSDQLPPHDVQAEESVIASLMLDPDAPAKVAPIVSAGDFFREANAWTFEACLALWERGASVDQVTVAHELDARGHLDDVGGIAWLSELINDLPTPVGVESWAAIVRRDAMYRQMIRVGLDVAAIGYDAPDDYEKALARAESRVYALREDLKQKGGFTALRELLGVYLDLPEQDDGAPRALQTVHTGLHALDAILDGLKQGYLIVIAARTSQGKTALMCNIATNAAVTQDARIAFFTLEMPEEQLARRILASYARVETRKIERRDYSEGEMQRVVNAVGILGSCHIYLYYLPGASVEDVEQRCRELARDQGLDMVVIDYLGLMTPPNQRATRNDQVGEITKALAKLAGQLDVPVVLGSQLNRQNEGQRPQLNDLRDSGNIEQDATVVVFIHREERHIKRSEWEKLHPDILMEPYPAGLAELIVAKNRNGQVGTATVRYRAPYTKFEDMDVPAATPVQGAIPEYLLNGALS